ncbi:MAG: FAD-dependent oxidoreductase [Phycisphaerales bacterium]|nr:FAD-dependent oxidoreductase [Phycisphaerales bacterium]
MVVGEFTQDAEVLVLGGGPAGLAAATRAASLGKQVILVDPLDCPPLEGVDILRGSGRFVDKRSIQVTGEEVSRVRFNRAIICTGCAMGPDALVDLPMTRGIRSDCKDAVLVSGSGTLAVATAMRHARAGADVVLTCPSTGLLPDFDPVLSAVVLEGLASAQIDVLPDVSFAGAEAEADAARVVLDDGTVLGVFESVVPAQPTGGLVDGLDLSNTTVQLDQSGWISVDQQGMTGETRIRAAGGVTGQALEPGAAHRHGEVVAEVVCGLDSTWDPAVTPFWLDTPIEVSWCGLNETRAAELGHDPVSSGHGQGHGMIRMVHDRESGLLLGAGAAGSSARIVAESAVLAIEMGATIEDLAALTPVDATLPDLGTVARSVWTA